MDTILIYPPDMITKRFHYSVGVPLGIATLKGYLKQNNITDLKILDCKTKNVSLFLKLFHRLKMYTFPWFYKFSNIIMSKIDKKEKYDLENFIEKGLKDSPHIKRFVSGQIEKNIIEKNESHLIGFSISHTSQLTNSIKIAKMIKSLNRNSFILFGGPLITNNIDFLTRQKKIFPIIDGFIINDGRKPLLELIKALNHKTNLAEVPNLYFKIEDGYKKGKNKFSDKRITVPDFDFTDLDCLTMQVSKGCYWNKCAFCTYCKQDKYALLDIDDTIHQIEEMIKKYNPKKIMFIDNTIPSTYLKELSNKIIEKGIDITWGCFNLILEKEFIDDHVPDLMYKAGCRDVRFGLESMSPRILKLIGKKHDPILAHEILNAFKKTKIGVKLNVMFGFPTETKKEAKLTLDFLINNKSLYREAAIQQFSLQEKSKIFISPNKYGVTQIYKTKNDQTKRMGYKYEVNSGMNRQEAKEFTEIARIKLKDKCLNTLSYLSEYY